MAVGHNEKTLIGVGRLQREILQETNDTLVECIKSLSGMTILVESWIFFDKDPFSNLLDQFCCLNCSGQSGRDNAPREVRERGL